jgi:hypothetical protein
VPTAGAPKGLPNKTANNNNNNNNNNNKEIQKHIL